MTHWQAIRKALLALYAVLFRYQPVARDWRLLNRAQLNQAADFLIGAGRDPVAGLATMRVPMMGTFCRDCAAPLLDGRRSCECGELCEKT